MKLFNKKRSAMLKGKRFSSYLIYAFGEIILVVLGILIAVSINNWNENTKQKQRLKGYLKIYKIDLEMDTLNAGMVLKGLDAKKKLFKLFLSDTVNEQTYKDNPEGFGLILSFLPYKMQTKGYGLLVNHTDENEEITDSLVTEIIASHAGFTSLVETSSKFITDDVKETMFYLKENEPWIGDMLQGNLSDPEMYDYFLSRPYKARLAVHQQLVINNMAQTLKAYKVQATEHIKRIENRLGQD